ncbi:MAG: Ldh family oxidoreductase [Acidimicrobiia bacterium]
MTDGTRTPSPHRVLELATEPARRVLEGAFTASGTSPMEAARIVDALLDAEACEVPTHGLLRVPWYLAALRSGSVSGGTAPSVERLQPAVALIDGHGSYGYLPTWLAVEEATVGARTCGVGVAGVRRIAEFGRAAYYVSELARRGFVGIACQNTMPLIAPPGAKTATHGNNPLAFSAPGDDAPVFDAALTPRSGGELRRRALLGIPLPAEWGYTDEDGTPTTDPRLAASVPQQAIGGPKGFGVAVLVDLLAGIMSGAESGVGVAPGEPTTGAMVIAFDPEAFGTTAAGVSEQLSRSAEVVRDAGGRWPGDRARSARTAALERGSILVPEPILAAAFDEVGDALHACVIGES